VDAFDLKRSLANARRRLGGAEGRPGRRARSDRGVSRLDPQVLDAVAEATAGAEKPPVRDLLRRIADLCRARGVSAPSRATLYHLLPALPGPAYSLTELPEAARAALYNLAAPCEVPGRQVAFCCFNYGDLRAASFAAGMPWLAIWQAQRLPGWRERSRGLAEAAALVRGI
jgi:hypothetical protein